MGDAVGLGLVERARDDNPGRLGAGFRPPYGSRGRRLAGLYELALLGEVAYAAGHLDVTIEAGSVPMPPT